MISVTALSGYLYCPRKLYLEQVLKIVKPPKEALIKGSIRHQVYDKINKSEDELVKSIDHEDLKYIMHKYRDQYSSILRKVIISYKSDLRTVNIELSDAFRQNWAYILTEAETRAQNIHLFIMQHNVFKEELWEQLTPKIKSEFRLISENLLLSGIIDQIEYYEHEIIPYELKTGKAPEKGVWPGHKIQMAAYMLMLQETGVKIEKGVVKYLDLGENREIPMNPFLGQEVTDIRDRTISTLKSEKLPSIINNKNKCRVCELREKCYSM
jgi:CRISPR-associated protein Cas4